MKVLHRHQVWWRQDDKETSTAHARFSPEKFVHLKFVWTQLKNLHLRGPCSLRPCISRPYLENGGKSQNVMYLYLLLFLEFSTGKNKLHTYITFNWKTSSDAVNECRMNYELLRAKSCIILKQTAILSIVYHTILKVILLNYLLSNKCTFLKPVYY